jgi:riboflavin synthase
MFTGIIEERGDVRANDGHRLSVGCRVVLRDSDVGASICVNGVCLTVIDRAPDRLAFDLSDETIARSSLGALREGDVVNLERPVTLAARLGGHLVQGHVDGVGVVVSIVADDGGGAVLRFHVPEELRRYIVEKGSVAVDGISLTASEVHDDGVSVALVPHTMRMTTLGDAAEGDRVNLEVDIVAKYVERLMEGL